MLNQIRRLYSLYNLHSLHSRDLAYVKNKSSAQECYLLKTYNFWSNGHRDTYSDLFVYNIPGLIDDAPIKNNI